MVRFSMNELTTFRWSLEEDVTHYSAAGIGAMGVSRWKLSDLGEEKGIDLLAEAGMAVSNLLWAGGFTGSEGLSFDHAVRDARQAVELAAALRSPCLVIYSGARAGHTDKHAQRLLVDGLRKVEPFAAEHGVTLAVEPMHRACAGAATFLYGLDDVLEILDLVASPFVKLVFDTFQLGHERDIVKRLTKIVDRIAIVHLADSRRPPCVEANRCRLGDGRVPLEAILSALASAGYDGYCDVELMGEEIEAADYVDLLHHSKQTFERLCELALAGR
jgi:sugar phosphate isomerase/epimerase